MLPFVRPGVCPPMGLLQVLAIPFSSYLSIRLFRYVHSVPIFLPQNCFVSFAPGCSFVFMLSSMSCWQHFLSLFLLLDSIPVSFGSPCFHRYFGLFLPVILPVSSAVVFSVISFQFILVYFSFLSTLACSRSFFIYHCSFVPIKLPSFRLGFFRGYEFYHKTNFAPASFSSVMSSVSIFFYNLFTFSVSTWTFYRSWFFRDGNVPLLFGNDFLK